jgi:hypothetical protein
MPRKTDRIIAKIRGRPSCGGRKSTCDAVKVTPPVRRRRNVVLEKKFGGPTITKDGVTVRQGISSVKDPLENMGAQMVREVASKTPTVPATAPPPRPFWRSRSSAKA